MVAHGNAVLEAREWRVAAPLLLWLIGALAGIGLLAIVADAFDDPAVSLRWTLGGVMVGIVCIVAGAGVWLWRRAPAAPTPSPAPGAANVIDLIRDKDTAQAANAAKSRFLASVSHEIRSPLNSIYGYAQLLERGGEVNPSDAARVICRSAEHLTSLVEGLLDMSQVESGVVKVNRDVIRFAPFLDQIASMFRHSAAARGLRLVYDRPEILPDFVRMDQARLRQVLINLLSNAIKFTPAGTVGFRVVYSGQLATFEICDTGPGIAPEHQDTIFAPFDRGGDPEAHEQPGAGLGLAITQALVQILGGDLQMDSTLGIGTVFRVTVMLGHVPGQISEAAPVALIGGYEGPRRSVLIVDDDIHQLSLSRVLLDSLGFDVAIASRGDVAVAIGRAKRFDLAVLDIAMPGMSGWDIAQHLHRLGDARPRIIMLSANAPEQHRGDAIEPAHDLFLLKPVNFDRLIDAIGSQLGLRWTSSAAEPAGVERGADSMPVDLLPDDARLHLRKIRDLLRIGHVRGIESEIKALEQATPQAHGLTARLYGYLDRFDFSGLGATIERHL